MSNCRIIFFIAFIWIAGCKPSSLSFTEARNIDTAFFRNIPAIANFPNIKIDSIRVYKAVLEEQVIERESVPEFTLINVESKKPTVDYPVIGHSNHLYFFRIYSSPEKKLCVFLSAGYFRGACTGLGPAYLGGERIDRYHMFSNLKVAKSDSAFTLEDRSGKVSLFFYADKVLARNTQQLTIYQVLDNGLNKIAGAKPVVYNVEKIFNDARALVFNYDHTIRYQ